MNYKKVKDLVIEELGLKPLAGEDEYRSTQKQLDNFIGHLEEGSPLKWLPIEYMTEEELAGIALNFISRDLTKNRLLYMGLSHKGIKYDYSDLQVVDFENKKEQESIYEELPVLKDYEAFDIAARILDVNVELVGAR